MRPLAYNCAMTNPASLAQTPRRIVVFGGGTVMYVRNHMALCAPAYGATARKMAALFEGNGFQVDLRLTKMADSSSHMETNMDVADELHRVLADPNLAGIVFNVALCDFEGHIGHVPSGKYAERLQTREVSDAGLKLTLKPTPKLLGMVKTLRPDVKSIGFKTTADEPADTQITKANRMASEHGITWMLANDTVTRNNIVLRSGGRTMPRTLQDALYNGTVRNEALAVLAQGFLDDVRRG